MCEYVHKESYDGQLEKIQQKGIIINSELQARQALQSHSYYTIINGYKRYFLKEGESDLVREGVTFDDFMQVYFLDVDISNALFKYIIYIEKSIRSRLSYTVAMNIGDTEEKYLIRSHYSDNRGTRATALKSIENVINESKRNSTTKHFKDTKLNIPPWIVVNDLSFSTVIFWYDMLDDSLKREIRKDYFDNSGLYPEFQEIFFYNNLQFLREYRNQAAHGKIHFKEKISHSVHFQSAKHFFNNTLYDDELALSGIGRKDLYAAISVILGFTMDVNLKAKFIEDLLLRFLPYINGKTFAPTKRIADQTIYDLFDLPHDLFERIYLYLNTIKS
ncbi:hypothetical protein CL176_02275 [Suicoccus acidiformans]|uniref:CAAX protease n=1 Tax=Suicoccus acidiformans TaxID=2036206 RepID=A0A347WIN8_9LACT|nr:Abi family protein [Suicoccus acidiformans]AXY24945.1 hypothetical protein CL176_02275 [Suicoccus acidiformans]